MSSSSSYSDSDESQATDHSKQRKRKLNENPTKQPTVAVNMLPSMAIRKKPKGITQQKSVENSSESSSSEEEQKELPTTRRFGRKRILPNIQSKRAKKDSSDSEWESQDEEDTLPKKKKLHPMKKKPTKNNDKSPNPTTKDEHRTELLFSNHILAEEIQTYLLDATSTQDSSWTATEQEYLQTWASCVQKALDQQNQVLLENINLVHHLRKVSRRRNQWQDKLLVQKKNDSGYPTNHSSYPRTSARSQTARDSGSKRQSILVVPTNPGAGRKWKEVTGILVDVSHSWWNSKRLVSLE
jgi:hypothetical protein